MIAVIDIGSNSVRLMLWADGKILVKKMNTTRLGEGLGLSGELSKPAIERTARAVEEYAKFAIDAGAKVYAFATAAVRASKNSLDFTRRVFELCGLEVDVVSEEREANLALFGALGERDGGVIDIGGASTEVIVKEGGKISFVKSFPIGAVKIFDACGEERQKIERYIEENVKETPSFSKTKFYAIGGTATTVASLLLKLEKYEGEKVHGFCISLKDADALSDELFSLSKEERAALPGMDKRRADIIAGGALLLVRLMQKIGIDKVSASDRDNLEGYLFERGLATC